jgi:TetR/AcrR family transcriptional regulator, transcriptional repressor for nem operon
MTKGEETRSRILGSATALINRKGLKRTSIQDIIEETGVKKGNFYFHFQSKDALGVSLLRAAKEEFFDYLSKQVKSSDPVGKLSDTFTAVFKYHRRRKFIGGCIFANTALEMSDTDQVYTAIIQEVFNEWVDWLASDLREGIEDGVLSNAIEPDSMARHIVASLEGSIMLARLYKRDEPIVDCIKYLNKLMGIEDNHRKSLPAKSSGRAATATHLQGRNRVGKALVNPSV